MKIPLSGEATSVSLIANKIPVALLQWLVCDANFSKHTHLDQSMFAAPAPVCMYFLDCCIFGFIMSYFFTSVISVKLIKYTLDFQVINIF